MGYQMQAANYHKDSFFVPCPHLTVGWWPKRMACTPDLKGTCPGKLGLSVPNHDRPHLYCGTYKTSGAAGIWNSFAIWANGLTQSFCISSDNVFWSCCSLYNTTMLPSASILVTCARTH